MGVVHLVKEVVRVCLGLVRAGALSCPRGEREGAPAGLGACEFGGMVSEEPRAWSLRLRAKLKLLRLKQFPMLMEAERRKMR